MTKPKLHFFCDNTYWSGAEQLLTCLFGSGALREAFDLSFSYRYTRTFYDGMCRWLDVAGVKSYPVSYPLEYTANRYLKRLVFYSTAFKIRRAMRAFEPDIVHVHNGGYPAALGCNAAVFTAGLLRPRPKIVYFVSNMPKRRGRVQRWWEKGIDKLVVDNVDVFLSGSRAVGEELFYTFGIDDPNLWGKMRSIPTTIHPNRLAFSRNRIRSQRGVKMNETLVVSAGVLEKRKGYVYLLRAFAELAQKMGPKVHLWIIGKGPELNRLENSAYGCVSFIPDTSDAYSYINACDVYCQPSVEHEDFPVSVLQAMSLGKPVVCTDVAGMPEQIRHGIDGFRATPGYWGLLYDPLSILVAVKDKREEMGKNAREHFEQEFSYERIMDRYIKFYKGLVV